jgi:predicted acetyltransferase
MPTEYRELTNEDLEQAAHLEAVAFYNRPTPDRLELLRRFYPPQWTVGAFVDGKLVADVRTVPSARRINGGSMRFACVGPVTCLPEFRRQGHVAQLLKLSLERMKESGQLLSGLYTPHDALYARYGWERAESRRRYQFSAKDVTLRHKGSPGALDRVDRERWDRLDAIYRQYSSQRNGPVHRPQVWWQERTLRNYEDSGEVGECDALVWVSPAGEDLGYVVYFSRALPRDGAFVRHEIWVKELVALSGDAYLGLWHHILTHDIAAQVVIDMPPDDPFPDLVDDPWKVTIERAEGAMIRIVDVQEAINHRPHVGDWAANFTMRVIDPVAPWNDGAWRIDAAEGSMTAEPTDDPPDVELTIGALAPIFTGYMRADVAANVGLLKANRTGIVAELMEAFAVTHPPSGLDFY